MIGAFCSVLGRTPLAGYSVLLSLAGQLRLPASLRKPVWESLSAALGIDLSDAAGSLSDYGSFCDLFSRRLRAEARPIDQTPDSAVVPADGLLAACGMIAQGRVLHAKGVDYSAFELVRDAELANRLEGGSFAVVYLRPRDYHRVHSPVAGRLRAVRRIPGLALPVKPQLVECYPDLFVRNERVVFEMDYRRSGHQVGRLAVVCVGAVGVRSITSPFLREGMRRGAADAEEASPEGRCAQVDIGKGQEIAAFNLGSTVVVLFEPGLCELSATVGTEVRVGQVIGWRSSEKAERL